MKITVVNNVTLDGVLQAPAAPDEDTRGGFRHGGWATPYQDQVIGEYMGARMVGGPGGMLFGRWTYGDLFSSWHGRTDDNPFTDVLDKMPKFVVSNTLEEPLPWVNSTVLRGDGADAVAELKGTLDHDLTILGSATLVQSLLARGLVDELLLTIHPVVLGSGRRLFAERDGAHTAFELVECVPTTTGVLIARYRLQP